MAVKTDQYFNMLTALLPQGMLWEQLKQDPNFVGLLQAAADELALLDAREDDLLDEADPRTTYEMLPDWEAAYALPDPCSGADLTLEQRRLMLVAKYTNKGGQNIPFYINLAAQLGYDITITEFSIFNFDSSFEDPMTDENWLFTWQVNAPVVTINDMTFESGLDEPWATWGNERLECAINRLKPAHTTLQFTYGE